MTTRRASVLSSALNTDDIPPPLSSPTMV